MKNVSIIITIIFFNSYKIHAQYKSIFGQTSTQWVYEWQNMGPALQDTVYVLKDTFAFGKNWKKITMSNAYLVDYKGALLREDTMVGKVWYKSLFHYSGGNWPPDTVEYLCYDFSLLKNDTFDLSSITSSFGFKKVDTIYYVNNYKFTEFPKSSLSSLEGITFIEGIGGNIPPIWKQKNGLFLGPYLLCSYKDGVQTFYKNKRHNGNCNVHIPEGLTSYLKTNDILNIYPIPSSDIINIDLLKDEYKITNVQLYKFMGNLVSDYGKSDYGKSEIFDISKLSNGIYLLKITLNNNIQFQKIIQKK